eukprot:649066_1
MITDGRITRRNCAEAKETSTRHWRLEIDGNIRRASSVEIVETHLSTASTIMSAHSPTIPRARSSLSNCSRVRRARALVCINWLRVGAARRACLIGGSLGWLVEDG